MPQPKARAGSTKAPIPKDAPEFFVQAFERASKAGKSLVLDFWAEWCVACLRLKRQTLEHHDLSNALAGVEMVYIDLDKYPALGEAYEVAAIPDVFFVDRQGVIVDRLQIFEPPEQFLARLRKLLHQPRDDKHGNAGEK